MEIIIGKYTQAIVHTAGELEPYARAQLQMLCDNECLSGSRIRVMPGVHPGKVGTIGLTMTVGKRLMPFLTGIDIGCGVTMVRIRKGKREWDRLDSVIRNTVPAGSASQQKPHAKAAEFDFSLLFCAQHIRVQRAALALGSLGSGNHFIEVGTDGESLYLFIHSGSRILGKEVAEHYAAKGQAELKSRGIDVPYELTWLDGTLLQAYLHDAAILQGYAELNRQIMAADILKGMKWKANEMYSCPHNYIATDEQTLKIFGAPILRKGAISAMKDEQVIIPINARDGVILGTGLGNFDWNCSAPHGAGRILKREEVRKKFTLSAYKAQMKGIHSMSISAGTLDEAPFAYRSLEDITDVIASTVKIEKIIKPAYNFKAGDRR